MSLFSFLGQDFKASSFSLSSVLLKLKEVLSGITGATCCLFRVEIEDVCQSSNFSFRMLRNRD